MSSSICHLNHNYAKAKKLLYIKTEDIRMYTQNGDFNFTNSSYPYALSDADISRVTFSDSNILEDKMGPNIVLPSKPYQKS